MKEQKQGWDKAAKEDVMLHTLEGERWTRDEYFLAGTKDAEAFARILFDLMDFNPSGKRMLDIGCGIGRVTTAFADMFGEAYGVDFSPEMIARARELSANKSNLYFAINDGTSLSMFEGEYFDFCFSYAMFQHITEIRIINEYICEIGRVLKPGGIFAFNFNGRRWGPAKFPIIHRDFYSFLLRVGLISKVARIYFRIILGGGEVEALAYPGLWLSEAKLERMVRQAGLELLQTNGKKLVWFSGRKPRG